MQIDVYNIDGQVTGKIELNDKVFGANPNEHALHLSVVTHLANLRQGTHKTKVRSEVSGGGKKPWKQKGRGTARSGSSRSPVWVGGGTIHGPKPHEYRPKLPKQINRLGRISAFSVRAQEQSIIILDDFNLEQIKTKSMAEILNKIGISNNSTLILTNENNKNIYLSARNIPKVDVNACDKISTYDILAHKKLVILKSAVQVIESSLMN